MSRSRWYAKKGARRALQELAWSSGSLAIRRALSRGPRIRALTYHRFGTISRDPFCVAGDVFERQMAWLARTGRAISPEALSSVIAGEPGAPADGVLVTIDDGFRSVHATALPILARHGIPALLFVCPGLVGCDPSARGDPEPYLSWQEIAELAAAGIRVGSHSRTHRSLASLAEPEMREEALRSRQELEQRLGREVRAFAYPFGTHADFGPATARVLRESGYRCAFTAQHGAIRPGQDPFALPRVKVEGGEGERAFRLLCDGGMDAWRLVDRALWRLQDPAASAAPADASEGLRP